MSVIACVKDENSQGSEKLKKFFQDSKRSEIKQVDIINQDSVDSLVRSVEELLKNNEKLSENHLIYK